ncbi:serine hydrolase family protein [Hymenobacter sp. 15J16-1T3B]|uniref:alpha/beta hydrolase n=1 Tax=Hymenobacter sp. 15J16-1T3B TaxID=2886941 RepID=UPI001D0FBCE7|nr:serine hydrolase family protein [Hymenobacter sp. 15J16-1T3B]MCC3156914.1 serine hydrolase family protein [Hymenobacter sp. 15J16-1T3B]
MDVHEHRLQVPRTARYFQLGELASARRLWVVCHGYGQLASYFIRHFRSVVEQVPGTVVVAPEGLSRFYLQGNGGRVGATWMTSEDRLTEIEDFSAYLDALLQRLLAQAPADVELCVLGFSQGATTVSRWLLRGGRTPAHLVLWAGTFPADVDPAAAAALLTRIPRLSFVCGDGDSYLAEDRVDEQLALLRSHGAQPHMVWFEGRHELKPAVLIQLAQQA